METEKQKKDYRPATAEIVRFSAEDVLTGSGTGGKTKPGINLPIDPFPTP